MEEVRRRFEAFIANRYAGREHEIGRVWKKGGSDKLPYPSRTLLKKGSKDQIKDIESFFEFQKQQGEEMEDEESAE
jgi:hypothetical protein